MSSHLPSTLVRILALALALFAATVLARAAPVRTSNIWTNIAARFADRLRRLYDAGDPARDRFIIVKLLEHPQGYSQCLFHDEETRMLCEASTAFLLRQAGHAAYDALRA